MISYYNYLFIINVLVKNQKKKNTDAFNLVNFSFYEKLFCYRI